MKRATIFAAALALVLSLTACGNRDNNGQPSNNQTNGNGTTENGTNSTNSTNGTNNATNGTNSTSNGVSGGSSLTNPNGSVGSTGAGNGTGTNSSGTSTRSRSSVGNDMRRAADDVGDAVTDLMDDGRNAVSRAASTTTFERMLDNARVHDTDGVLTDGENSRW